MRRSFSKSKLFSGAATDFGAAPNTQVSFVDAAMPGMLPVINGECVGAGGAHGTWPERADQICIAGSTGKTILCRSAARLPDQPVRTSRCRHWQNRHRVGGWIGSDHRCDAPASGAGRWQIAARPGSVALVHRSQPLGVALMEIVSEPDIRSPEEAGAYLLQAAHGAALSRHLRPATWTRGACAADVNVSVRKAGRSVSHAL